MFGWDINLLCWLDHDDDTWLCICYLLDIYLRFAVRILLCAVYIFAICCTYICYLLYVFLVFAVHIPGKVE